MEKLHYRWLKAPSAERLLGNEIGTITLNEISQQLWTIRGLAANSFDRWEDSGLMSFINLNKYNAFLENKKIIMKESP